MAGGIDIKIRVLTLLIQLGAVFSAPSAAAESGQYETSIEQEISRILNEGDGAGIGYGFVRHGDIQVSTGTGLANKAAGLPVTDRTIFQVASVSKLIIAAAFHQLLIDEGISVQTPLVEIAPEVPIRNPWSKTHPLRLVHLLEHTSGLQEVIAPWFDSREEGYVSQQEVLHELLAPVTTFLPPGWTATYSNYNYLTVSYLIEKISGRRFDDYISSIIFQPLGMTDSGFRYDQLPQDRMSFGYIAGKQQPVVRNEGLYRAAAGMYSSTRDLLIFIQVLLNRGRWRGKAILDPTIAETMQTPRSSLPARDGMTLGHGPGSVLRQSYDQILAGHNGMIEGFMARAYYSIEQQYGFVVLVNSHPIPTSPSISDVSRVMLKRFAPAADDPAAEAVALPPDSENWAGHYRFVNPRFRITGAFIKLYENLHITKGEQETILVRWGWRDPEEYVHIGGGLFRTPGQQLASLVIGKTPTGERYAFRLPNKFFLQGGLMSRWFGLIGFVLAMIGVLASVIILPWMYLAESKTFNRALVTICVAAGNVAMLGALVCALFVRTSQQATSFNPLSICILTMSALYLSCQVLAIMLGIPRFKKAPRHWQRFMPAVLIAHVAFCSYIAYAVLWS